jgi:hypothetical protein
VLIPTSITQDGTPITPVNPGIEVSALRGVQTTCTLTTFATFVVTGILAPTVP